MRVFFVALAAVASCMAPAGAIARPEVASDLSSSGDISVRWAVPHISAAHVRTEPRHGSEMSTQALMGWPVKVLERIDGWSYVELPDGYQGYVIDNSLTFMPSDSVAACWRESQSRVIAINLLPMMACDSVGMPVTDIVQGDILIALDRDDRYTSVQLPDGRTAMLPSSACKPVEEWHRNKPDTDRILAVAKGLIGVPYLWGGLTAKGMDCSGLTRMAYLAEGIMLPRDASQQVTAGIPVSWPVASDSSAISEATLKEQCVDEESHSGIVAEGVEAIANLAPADLLFFASETTGRINHVALYAGDSMMLEAAGRVMLSPVPWSRVVAVRRIIH